jgi:hypothetical protein
MGYLNGGPQRCLDNSCHRRSNGSRFATVEPGKLLCGTNLRSTLGLIRRPGSVNRFAAGTPQRSKRVTPLSEIGQQAATDQFVPRRAVTVDELCADWLASLHNARVTTLNDYRYAVAPLRERHPDMPVQRLTRPDLDPLLTDLRDGGTTTAKGHARRPWSPRSLNKAVDAWRAVLAYGIERRELGRNVGAAMKKVARTHQEMSTYTR